MRSLRTRIMLLAVCAIVIAVAVVTALSVVFIRHNESVESDQLLLLLCETGERNLDYYFDSVQKSVARVASNVEKDLDGIDDEHLRNHVSRIEEYFDQMAYKTNGVLTYYYRIDPAVSENVKGFWYTNIDGEGFKEHTVTDITQYDTDDTSKLVWFTVPKHTGKPIWLPPYITENLGARVISYNVPIYWRGQFVGVVGIEIDYSTMAEQVESIKLYNNGYAFLNDEQGNIFYHPYIDVATLSSSEMPAVPEGMVSNSTFFKYNYNGIEKRAVWLPLSNGMRLTVSVPAVETDGDWQRLIQEILLASIIVLVCVSAFALFYTSRITKPLEDLTRAAEQADVGNYDFSLEYDGDDEIGKLTKTFKRMAEHMKDRIEDLNERVYVDSLTSVKNKGAFSAALEGLQKRLDAGESDLQYAIVVFDCDDLKTINDRYGHDKGDMYLKETCHLICTSFKHSPVYRIGGDEFSVILQGEDFDNREQILNEFYEKCETRCETALNRWEQVRVTDGMAIFDPFEDHLVIDTVRRADKTMYANKHKRKAAR